MNKKTVILSIALLLLATATMISNRGLLSFRAACRTPLMPMFKTLTFFSAAMESRHMLNDILQNMGNYKMNDAEKTALSAENNELRKILEMSPRIHFSTLTAEVMKRTLDINGCIIINKGTSSGVDRQMGVMYLDGLIGKIIESGTNTSVVETYLNINYRISITDRYFTHYYICRSNGKGMLYIDSKDNCYLREGDTVFTSGLGRLYPKGIPVGIYKGYGLMGKDSVFIVNPIQHINTDFIFIIKQSGYSPEEKELSNNKELGRIGWYSIKSNI